MPVAQTTNHWLHRLPCLCPAAAEPCLWLSQALWNCREQAPRVVLRIAAADEVDLNCGLHSTTEWALDPFQSRLQQSLHPARSHVGSGSSIMLHKKRQTQPMTFLCCLHACELCADHVQIQQSTFLVVLAVFAGESSNCLVQGSYCVIIYIMY